MKILPTTKIYCTNTSSRYILFGIYNPYVFNIENCYCLIQYMSNATLNLNLNYGDRSTVIRTRNY